MYKQTVVNIYYTGIAIKKNKRDTTQENKSWKWRDMGRVLSHKASI